MNKIELKTNHLVKTSSHSNFQDKNIDYIEQYLCSLGIDKKDIISFIDRPREEDLDKPQSLSNIDEAVRTAWSQLTHGAKVFVIVDSDTDGYTSSSILINYIRRRFPDVDLQYHLHPGKEHGIVLEDIPEDRTLIFVPDAGSNNYDEQKALVDQGKTVIILDHHEVDNYVDTGAILVNNQFSPNFSNKYMSGAGVVFMFIMRMDQLYYPSNEIFQDYYDLAAIGIIADAMNMTSLGNNYIAYHGLKHIHNQLIKEIAIKQAHGIKNPNCLTKIDVAFYIAPIINGVIRGGDQEDKDAVIKAMCTEDSTEDIVTVWRGVERHETIYQYAARLAANAKGRQDAQKKKAFEWLCGKIKDEGHDQDNLILVTLDAAESKKVNPNFTGLIAMELVKEFNRPSLVLRETVSEGQKMYGGSGRNGSFYGLPDLKEFLHDAGVYYAEGHANAFGAFLLPDEVKKVRDYANIKLNPLSFETVYEVDYIFKDKYDIDYEMLYQMASYDDFWGNSIPQPKFAFTVDYSKTDILVMGKDHSSLKIRCGQIDFVAFKNSALVEEITSMPNGTATIVGRPQINEYNGNVNVQIMIDDIGLTEREEVIKKPQNLFDLI